MLPGWVVISNSFLPWWAVCNGGKVITFEYVLFFRRIGTGLLGSWPTQGVRAGFRSQYSQFALRFWRDLDFETWAVSSVSGVVLLISQGSSELYNVRNLVRVLNVWPCRTGVSVNISFVHLNMNS